jgi:DNA-binding beta-propeller fold protein YncE
MGLELGGYVELPPHAGAGGFDHAAVHRASGRLYVAHTANDAIDVIDCAADRYLRSIPSLTRVAGALVSDERNLVFTSNRGENTVGVFAPDDEACLIRIDVGVRPNGLAFDPARGLLLAANVGDPAVAGSFTVSMVDIARRTLLADVPVPGRTRWAVFDDRAAAFYVNIADPAQIVVIDARAPARIARAFAIPAVGPHGLDIDAERRRLYCACDGGQLVVLDLPSGRVVDELPLRGIPDVVFFNAALRHIYVAIGDPGVIDVFDTRNADAARHIETVTTERGAHTIAFDPDRNKIYAFLPQSHRAAVFVDA